MKFAWKVNARRSNKKSGFTMSKNIIFSPLSKIWNDAADITNKKQRYYNFVKDKWFRNETIIGLTSKHILIRFI